MNSVCYNTSLYCSHYVNWPLSKRIRIIDTSNKSVSPTCYVIMIDGAIKYNKTTIVKISRQILFDYTLSIKLLTMTAII